MALAISLIHHGRRSTHVISRISKSFYSTTPSKVFSDSRNAEFIAAAASASSIPKLQGLPEVRNEKIRIAGRLMIAFDKVIVTGRANCGKSTLLNAVLGRKNLLNTSKKAGRTRTLNFYRVGAEPGKLVVVDAPGYGARGRPEWGQLFDHYVQTREELKRVYILFNGKHTLNPVDSQMLQHLSTFLFTEHGTQPFTLQAVITKVDCIPNDKVEEVIKTMRRQIWEAAPLCLPPIITSSEMSPPFGIGSLRKNIADACGLR